MSLVTVIMPAYQAARTIVRAIESICAQEFTDWNLIVVDDASIDSTGALARKIAAKDVRIKVLTNVQNLGAATSMNIAWRSSSSPYIAIMDADDAALPLRLKLEVETMEARPELSVLGSAAHFVDSNGGYMRTVVMPTTHADLEKRRWYACPFVHPSVLMRRGFLEKMGGYTDGLRLGEDYDLWMRGFYSETVSYANLQEPLIFYTAKPVQSWRMIKASARARVRAGIRENRLFCGRLAAMRIMTEGIVERTGIFAWRDQYFSNKTEPASAADVNKV